jgi:predicted ATPase/DNA-binding CsgD family transcriptional regulator
MGDGRAARPAGNLPSPASSFVGRSRELTEVKRQLEAARLVTLTGPGGVGKTRLAIQLGLQARRAFRDGVWLVDLAVLEEPERLAETVAAALGVIEQSTRGAADQLADHLADRSLLLVLDNCEHLVRPSAALVDHLLRRAPDLKILATSRQPLGLAGEHLYTVPPLPAPDPEDREASLSSSRYDAVALLVDRAAAVQPDFAVDSDNSAAVARLCARLDGLPLAIELAATRLRTLSVEQLADRLDDRFELLTRGSPAALSRQQTLRALIDWSADLCTSRERLLWAALSVFPADFDLVAAEEICSSEDLGAHALVDVLDSLVAKSIVTVQRRMPVPRYRLLETIRHYGREVLAAGGQPELRRRHSAHYLRLAEDACAEWPGDRQAEILAGLREEHANLSAALDWIIAVPGEIESGLRLASALRYHWILGGFLATGRRRLDQVLDVHRDPAPNRARGDALWVTAWIALLQGDREAAVRRLAECDRIAVLLSDDHLAGYVSLLQGTLALFGGDLRPAVERFEAGLGALERAGDVAAVLWGQFQLSVALSHLGEHARADAVCGAAIHTAEERGETWARSEAMWARAFDRWLSGDPDHTAGDLDRAAIELTPDANQVSTVLSVELLAWIAASEQRPDDAAVLLGAAESVWRALGTNLAAFGPIFAQHSERCRRNVVAALGDARFSALVDRGLGLGTGVLDRSAQSARTTPARDEGLVLTPRERQVAELIADGLTNKAIAKALVLSPRTVDGYVERLFAKLEVGNRAQVAGWVHQHRVAQDG